MMHYKKVDGKWKSANEKKPVNSVYTADIMESEQNSSVPKPVLSLESVVTIPNPEKKGKNISTGTMYDKNADDLAIATEEDLPTGGALAKKAPALFSGAPPPVPRSPNTLDILNPDPETIDILEHEVNGVTIKKFDPKDIKITVLVEGPSVIGEYECTSVEFVFNDEIAVLRFKAKYGNAEPSYVYREKVEGEWRMTSRTVFDRRCREMDVDLSILSKPNVPQVEEVAPAPSKWNRLIFWR
ncbi:hypothetical protein BEWA_027390 [Theileria equi strain WA]|uniref:Uncharacterized protein n=1 Tax=Theileria equi strain WA TaxID=1537102 RepID=L0AWI2_THEEQ|nr:hypothetical protein BEWA_027390 [Theileria equi strain WA]AFZ79890.1 hypothetical protein BEWA_027390 [Theileria equi strain WA]|eukprot:XP_004829556.1 hypothetical protein BEWA_027390 [Theileria equi strain WA]